jgi:hypothetical protein
MKSQLERNNSEINIKQERENKEKNTEDKVKSLKNDINRKENIIKDLKMNYENYKQQNKKLIEENEDLIEKNKIKKIEVSRKEDIIKDLRNKIIQLNQDIEKYNKITETQASSNTQNNINYQKLKNENERKEQMIKTLKAKIESLNIELNQTQNVNFKLSKSSNGELEQERRLHSMTKNKLDNIIINNEKMQSTLRRILKDLLNTYEMKKTKLNIKKSMKPGLDILGVNENEVDDFLAEKDDETKSEITEKINKLLESNNDFDSEGIVNLYKNLKDKIIQNENNSNRNNYGSNFNMYNQRNYNNNYKHIMYETNDNSQIPNNYLESNFDENENTKQMIYSRSREFQNEGYNVFNNNINDYQKINKSGFQNLSNN